MKASPYKPLPDLMTVGELARYLHVHSTTVYRMLKRKEIPAFQVGSDWRFRRDAIDAWMIERTRLRL